MDDKELQKFKENLTALFYQFKDRPHLLAQYFIENDSFKEVFKSRIIENKKLKSLFENMSDTDKPFFKSVEEMHKFYNGFFEQEKKTHPTLGSSKEESLNIQLKNAIESEDYEKAAKIRDYMKKLNIDPNEII